jgi:hypothetical protein
VLTFDFGFFSKKKTKQKKQKSLFYYTAYSQLALLSAVYSTSCVYLPGFAAHKKFFAKVHGDFARLDSSTKGKKREEKRRKHQHF